jgi:intracellular sulfur oxidation DsrE/DsrF family protein
MIARVKVIVILLIALTAIANAEEQITYAPSKVVYDISTPDPEALGLIFDRVNMLQNIYQNDSFEASIVLVIHEDAIPLFGANDKTMQPELMQRARSLSLGEIIKFRVCKASAAMQGFKKNDLQDFIVMVPMADAEIVKLQQEGYAYLR